MEPYRYTPLEEGQTRLLQILPGPEEDLVSCQLFTVSLEDHPEYTALSYAWGAGTSDKTIIIDGKALLVGTNLDDALREFRTRPVWTGDTRGPDRIHSILKAFGDIRKRYSLPDWEDFVKGNVHRFKRCLELMTMLENSNGDGEKMRIIEELSSISTGLEEAWEDVALRDGVPRLHRDMPLIWIDAICINQEDPLERMEQVKLMREIYKGAYSLTVWLGVEADESSKAISVLNQIERDMPDAYYEKKMLEPGVQDSLYSIFKMFSRPWFGRLWILQEYALGRHSNVPWESKSNHVVFCCGRDRIEDLVSLGNDILQKVTASSEIARERTALLVVNRTISINLLGSFVTFSERIGETRNQLLSLTVQSSTANATDPRDKIYACIGLAEEIFHGRLIDLDYDSLIFDYAAPVEDVYSSFVRAVVSASNRLDILGLCDRRSSKLVSRTWTPDWTNDFGGILCIDLSTTVSNMQSLTYDVAPDSECVARFAPDLSTLTVSGIVWDGIMEVSSAFGANTEAQIKTECSLISDIAKILSGSQQGQRENDHYTSFAKTLAWDRDREREGGTISQSWVRSFGDWLADPPPGEQDPVSTPPQKGIVSMSEFLDAFRKTMRTGKRIVMTNGGCLGRTECEVKSDDLVCIILGCAMPMVLRPVEDHYEVIGEVYLDVIMHGEGMVALREGKRTLQEFELH